MRFKLLILQALCNVFFQENRGEFLDIGKNILDSLEKQKKPHPAEEDTE